RLLFVEDYHFVFQAEDGIRDKLVTGVQTCALPICFRTNPENAQWVQKLLASKPVKLSRAQIETLAIVSYRQPVTRPEIDEIRGRSEERRVGKECRCRLMRCHTIQCARCNRGCTLRR